LSQHKLLNANKETSQSSSRKGGERQNSCLLNFSDMTDDDLILNV
jgi:hypothetical protein